MVNSNGLCLLNADGECTTCGKSAINSFVTCFMCQDKFHAVGCSTSSSICNQSYLLLFKPLSEKTGVNAARPGNFLFSCDSCLTKYEQEQSMVHADKFTCLQNQVTKLDQSMADIKKLLLKNDSCNTVQMNDLSSKCHSEQIPSCWSKSIPEGLNKSLPITHTPTSFTSPTADNKKEHPILIIEKTEDPASDRQTLDFVENLIVDSNIGVKNSYENKKGNTIVVCASNKQRDLLQSQIKEKSPMTMVKSMNANTLTKKYLLLDSTLRIVMTFWIPF